VIIPRKTVNELCRLFEGAPEEIEVQVSESSITFTIGAVRLYSKLIDGTFPDYQRVIPAGNDMLIKISKGAFMGAVDRVATVASDRARAVRVTAAPGEVVLSVRAEGNEASERIDVDTEAKIEIGFNARYLMDIGDQIDGDEAALEVRDAGSPALIREIGDDRARYVLMPMRA
jgi:DNA polymerase-3 subunit beta